MIKGTIAKELKNTSPYGQKSNMEYVISQKYKVYMKPYAHKHTHLCYFKLKLPRS